MDPSDFAKLNIGMTIPQMPDFDRIRRLQRESEQVDLGFAHVMYECLVAQIRDFEKSINPDEEVAAYLASFGTRMLVLIDNVGFHNPYYIVFNGVNAETGDRVRLVQHTTQTSVLLVAAKVEVPRKPRRVGFYVEDESESSE